MTRNRWASTSTAAVVAVTVGLAGCTPSPGPSMTTDRPADRQTSVAPAEAEPPHQVGRDLACDSW